MSEFVISEADVKRNFDNYDIDKNGIITFDEMGIILSKCNPSLDTHTLSLLLSKYDHNHDGNISYQEFIGFLTGNPLLGLDLPPLILVPMIPVEQVLVSQVAAPAPVSAVTTSKIIKETVTTTTTTTTVVEESVPVTEIQPVQVSVVQGSVPLLPDIPIVANDANGQPVQVNVIPFQEG